MGAVNSELEDLIQEKKRVRNPLVPIALTSGMRLITKAAFDKTDHGLRKGVILFLAITTFFEFLCIFLYAYVFGKLPIVKYYREKAASEGSKTVTADLAAAGIQSANSPTVVDDVKHERLSNKQLIFQNVDYIQKMNKH